MSAESAKAEGADVGADVDALESPEAEQEVNVEAGDADSAPRAALSTWQSSTSAGLSILDDPIGSVPYYFNGLASPTALRGNAEVRKLSALGMIAFLSR